MPQPTSANPLLAGVDLGTTNIKALIFEPNGRVVAEASVPTPTYYPRPTWAYHNPEELWRSTVTALRRAINQLPRADAIAGIAVSSFGEMGVPLDRHGRPTADAIAWFDRRTYPQMTWLEQHLGQDRLFAVTGLPLLVIYGLCKLLWLKENDPDAFSRTALWLNGADYIAYRLSGTPATDYSLASRMCALDLYQRRWAEDLLTAAGIPPALLAPLTPGGTSLGPIRPDVAQETGLPTQTRVAVGGHDHICGAFATGVNRPGQMLNSLGTAEAIFLPVERPFTDPIVGHQGYTQGLLAVLDQDYYYALGGLYTAGGSVEWLRAILSGSDNPRRQIDYATLIAEAEQVPPGSLGVCFLPYLRMANPPHVDVKAKGAFIGLNTDVKRGALFRAVLEGLAYEVRLCLESLLAHQNKAAADQIYATGGGTRNPLYMRLKATVLNRPINLIDLAEGVALGAAMMGGLGAGVYPDVASALETVRFAQTRVEPDSSLVALYEAYYQQVYRHLYAALRPLHHQLHDLQQRQQKA